MKTMFQMGFNQDVFGSRMGNPMLGRVPIRLAQTTANGDQLLQQLQVAQGQVAQANTYMAQHPNLQQDLGADLAGFQSDMSIVSDSDRVNNIASVIRELQATAPGQQYTIASDNYNDVQLYIQAASALAGIMQAHPSASPAVAPAAAPAASAAVPAPATLPGAPTKPVAPTPGGKPVAVAPAQSDLTAPLLVGGGVLAIGVIALLARG